MNNTTFILCLLTVSLFVIAFYSCKKDIDNIENDPLGSYSSYLTGGGGNDHWEREIILGDERNLPFTVDNMVEAYRDIYGPSQDEPALTHYYIRFAPETYEELRLLSESDLSLLNFPVHYDIIQMGDFYIEPNLSSGVLAYYYATVPHDMTIPSVPYAILEDLHLEFGDENLTRMAIARAGYAPDITGYPTYDPNFPPPPLPGPVEPPPGPLVKAANCSACRVGLDSRNPAGCITLEDTQLSSGGACDKAVGRVKVTVKDYWFLSKYSTYTNPNGCYAFRDLEFKGNAWLGVEFKNEYSTIHSVATLENFPPLNMWFSAEDKWIQFSGPNFNNMDRCYQFNNNTNSEEHNWWKIATIHNSVLEYRDWSTRRSVTPAIQQNLKIITTNFDNSGAAPMLHKIVEDIGFVSAINDPKLGDVFGLGGIIPTALWLSVLPDLVINIENARPSDWVKELCYHELAHAHHYRSMAPGSRSSYWVDNILYIIANSGTGDGTAPGAGSTQIIEMWASAVAPTAADLAYGLDHSNGGLTPEERRYLNLLEGTLFERIHIPAGIFHDLWDHNVGGQPGIFEHLQVAGFDNIGGYSYAQFLNDLDHTITSPVQFREHFKSLYVPTGQHAALDELFERYGH